MTEPVPAPAEQTAAAVAAAYPGLRQAEPHNIGDPLSTVNLNPDLTARYTWGGYDIHVAVGHEDHLNRADVEDRSLQREVRAYATLPVPKVVDAEVRGHVEWGMRNPRPDIRFPTAYSAAAAALDDSRLASAVLATVALALDYMRIATEHAGPHAADAAEEAQWERDRPKGIPRSRWQQQKRAERAARRGEPETP
ncbi:hypothetical protein [Streptomyces sp. NPDC059788]|uniref:hypothetical protein n=1 Tax=Streptomyces sp. NPDC059788 TaxID=3346948 RepID=UPI0036627F03